MRFVLNFNNKCNLSCEWCYVNFNGEYPQKEKIINIIDIVYFILLFEECNV